MPIRRPIKPAGTDGAGQGGNPSPVKPPAPLRRLPEKKVVNAVAPTVDEGAVGDETGLPVDKLAELTERVEALEQTVKELTSKVEEHEAEIDSLQQAVNSNGTLAFRMAKTAEEVSSSLDRASGLMQTLTAMVSSIIPLFQELNRPQPRGLYDALRLIQEEHDHIRMVVLPRAMQDSHNVESQIQVADETRH
jgi:chromosome segregation ATPase